MKRQNLGARRGFPFRRANPTALIYRRPGWLVPSEKKLIAAVFQTANNIFAEEPLLPVALLHVFVRTGDP